VWGGANLMDLDERFKTLLDEKRIPHLVGVEAYENHFILHRKWLPDIPRVVTELSAGRYFGRPVCLRKTNHFSSVKPFGVRHPAHELLVDFWTRHFETSPRPNSEVDPIGNDFPIQTSYYCYISRDKVDQLCSSEPVKQSDPSDCIPEIRALLEARIPYGRSDVLQRNAAIKRDYLQRLTRVLNSLAQRVHTFYWKPDHVLGTELYWYRGEFVVDEIDQGQLMAKLVSRAVEGELVLYCSLWNFSDEPVKDGAPHLHSTNYPFFHRKLRVTFECVFYLLSISNGIFTGSPLFLKLSATEGVVL
jgi:hypothetical protein